MSLCLLTLLFVSTALGQVPDELINGLKWRLIGPFRGGRVVAVAGVPGDSTTFYFGGVNGGVWKSTDAGMVWKPIFDKEPVGSIGAIAVAASDAKVIYVGTGESDIRSDLSSGNGVYKSVDGGETWTHIGLEDTRQISRIVIDPKDANVVYVGALGHAYGPNEERGVFKSSDGGAHWKKVLDQGTEIGISDLAICAGDSRELFAGTWHTKRPPWSTYAPIDGSVGALFRSKDAGETWAKLSDKGLPDGDWGRVGVDVAPDGKRVYALIQAKKAGLYRSDDGGDTWTLANSDSRLTSRAWYFNSITIDPQNEDVFYVPNVALYRSEDGGKTISIVRGAPGGDDYHQLWVDPKNSASMVLGTDQGTTVSLDHGKTWSTWYNQPTAQLYHVITDNEFPYVVYGAQQDSGSAAVVSRTDHGQITPRDWFPAGGSESGYMAPDPKDANIVYLSSTYGGVERFNRKTGFSQDITPWPVVEFGAEINKRKYRDPWTPVLVFSAAEESALYLGTQYVMKTVDGGLHWVKISPDLTGAVDTAKTESGPATFENAKKRGYGVVFTIAPSKLDRDLIWAGSDTGLIHVTRDGGKNWKDVTPKGLSDWSKISLIEASHFDPAVAYAAVDRSRIEDQKPYLYRTQDYGATWQLITAGIADHAFLRAVREDPETKGLLFSGTELGVYISADDGDHWQPLQMSLPVTSVRDLVIHGDDLVIATHGRSFWILDDIAPLRQTADAAKQNVFLYRPAGAMRVDNDGFAGTPLPPEEPTAENPPNGATIDYFLKMSAGKITLEIFDGQHRLVRRFSSENRSEAKHPDLPIAERWFPKPQVLEKSPGMHRFIWDLRWVNSGASDAEEDDDYRAPNGPKAMPGSYEVKLTVDGQAQSQSLKILMDPRSNATAATLQQQVELAGKMYADTVDARRAMAEIGAAQKQIGEMLQKAKNEKLTAALKEAKAETERILSGKTGESVGLREAYAGIASALRMVESGDREPPSQASVVYEEFEPAMKARITEWNNFKEKKWNGLKETKISRADELRKFDLSVISAIDDDVDYLIGR